MKKNTNISPLDTKNSPLKKNGKLLSTVTHLLLTLSIIFLISWYHAKTVQETLDTWKQDMQN